MARSRKKETPERVIKDKFQEKHVASVAARPIYPMNDRQAEYMQALRDKEIDLIISTGYAGTSKTFLATVMAADAYRTGAISKIVLARPAISNSQSLGFFSGDSNEKMMKWVMPLISVLNERIGKPVVDLAIQEGNILLQPLETVKGMSFGKNTWVICDEVEDCTIDEIKSITTRNGGCKMVLCGDIMQSALREDSGLRIFVEQVLPLSPKLMNMTALIEFDSLEHIVRSKICKELILAFDKAGI